MLGVEARSSFIMLMLVLLVTSFLHPTEQSNNGGHAHTPILNFDRSYFPSDFAWGAATSAYQTEGEAFSKGKKPSTWDTFTHKYPERIQDRRNGDVAVNYYNYYKEDIKKMNEKLGMNAFRFSISWPRVIPTGKISDGINEEGIQFYNNVINEALKNGLEPYATIFHWDVPQGLEDKYGGFLSPNIVSDFKDYATLCFERFGDRVKHWITINEPFIFTTHGYDGGDLAPGRCSSWVNSECRAGNSATEPYIVGHNVLMAHAAAVQVYRQKGQTGKIGITLDITWAEPYSNSTADRTAAKRNLVFSFGWFMEAITFGQYPKLMLDRVGKRMKPLNKYESQLLKGSYDFIGINYYTANYVRDNKTVDPNHIRYATDSDVTLTKVRDGQPIGLQASPTWLYIYPKGIRFVLKYIKETYKDPVIYITENGIGDDKNGRRDIRRIQYHREHLWNIFRAICKYDVKVKGYFAWSFIDNFEWANGYTVKMGLYAVDKNLNRLPKFSVSWFKKFLENKSSGGPKCTLH